MKKIFTVFISCICFFVLSYAVAEDSVKTESSVVIQEKTIDNSNTTSEKLNDVQDTVVQDVKNVKDVTNVKDEVKNTQSTSFMSTKDDSLNQGKFGAPGVGSANLDLAWFLVCSFGVIGLIYFLAWLLKKMKFLPGLNLNKNFRTLGVISLGAKEKLVLVKVGDEQIVVGVTPQNITMVHKLSEPIEATCMKEETETKNEQNGFSSLFQKLSGSSPAKSNNESDDKTSEQK